MGSPSFQHVQVVKKYESEIESRVSTFRNHVSSLTGEIDQLQRRLYFSFEHLKSMGTVERSTVARLDTKVTIEHGKSIRRRLAELDSELYELLKEFKGKVEDFTSPESQEESNG